MHVDKFHSLNGNEPFRGTALLEYRGFNRTA